MGSGIATIGHPVDLQTEWVFRKGDLGKKGEFLEYDAAVSQGYSGGPLVNEVLRHWRTGGSATGPQPADIDGEMTVIEATPDNYRVEMSVQLRGANCVTVFDGVIQGGSLFTGTVVDSNLWPAGTVVVIDLFNDGYNLTMTLPDGTVYQWAER